MKYQKKAICYLKNYLIQRSFSFILFCFSGSHWLPTYLQISLPLFHKLNKSQIKNFGTTPVTRYHYEPKWLRSDSREHENWLMQIFKSPHSALSCTTIDNSIESNWYQAGSTPAYNKSRDMTPCELLYSLLHFRGRGVSASWKHIPWSFRP